VRTQMIAMMAALAGVTAHAAEATATASERRVTVCVEGAGLVRGYWQARYMASRMFGVIGVAIDWRPGFGGCGYEAIRVSLTDNTPADLKPTALAYALPYEGTHVRIFYDRIAYNREATAVPPILAHVLVHEITHMLEGICHHSPTGIMMAHWGPNEFNRMARKPMEFSAEDTDLIYLGLMSRRQAMTARTATAAVNTR